MITDSSSHSNGRPQLSEMRAGIISAVLLLAVSVAAKVAVRLGWVEANDIAQRAVMVIVAAFIVATGNTIPKRLAPRACRNMDASRVQAFGRLAGWTWVLGGIGLGLVWIVLPVEAAGTATLVLMPVAIGLVALGWLRLKQAAQ